MSSDRCGVQSVICEILPSAVYVHCASHCLSLVIVNTCQRTSVKSSIDKISNVGSKFCVNNVKRFKQCCAYRFYLLVTKMSSNWCTICLLRFTILTSIGLIGILIKLILFQGL